MKTFARAGYFVLTVFAGFGVAMFIDTAGGPFWLQCASLVPSTVMAYVIRYAIAAANATNQ